MEKHILFFNPPSQRPLYRGVVCTWVSKAKYLWQPFDFILLSAMVPASAKISYIDSFIHGANIEDIIRFINANNITRLVMSMSSIEWANDLDGLTKLRKGFPLLKIMVLGDVFQERYFIDKVAQLDVTILRHPLDPQIKNYFEADKIDTPALLQNIDNNNKTLPPLGLKQCVEFPMPRYETFLNNKHRSPFDKYRRSAIVNISWGCPYACSYCSWSSPYLPFVFKSARSIINELEFLHKLKIKEIFFGDLNFGNPPDIAYQALDAMIKRHWKFSWHCYIRPGSIQAGLLAMMRKAGCHTVIIGIENPRVELSQYNRRVSLQDIKNTIKSCHELGMDVCGDFILGLDGSTENWRELVKFAIKLKLDFASFNVYTPLLGSLERHKKIDNGLMKEGEWGFDTTAYKKSMVEHSENRAKCVKMFYGRPVYWLKRLSKIKSLDELFIKLEEAIRLF